MIIDIPFEPVVFNTKVNIHLILEYLAFFTGFRYYVYLRKRSQDAISSSNRISIILGAVFGALLGSRVMGFLEHPEFTFTLSYMMYLLNVKTIMGGLFGGLLGVELAKKCIGEKHSSGDLFTFPILLGIIIGRVGCFLSGTNEFTYGKETSFFMGMDLGDDILRHPVALYEVIFLILLWVGLKMYAHRLKNQEGVLFQCFMILYFLFRFGIEFLKPNTFFILGLSSIQYLCIFCFFYYRKTIQRFYTYILHKK